MDEIEYTKDLSPDDLLDGDTNNLDSKDVTQIHQMKGTVKYTVNIPGHPPRKESDVFKATKKHLIKDLDTPCWVCGSKLNREVHHFFFFFRGIASKCR